MNDAPLIVIDVEERVMVAARVMHRDQDPFSVEDFPHGFLKRHFDVVFAAGDGVTDFQLLLLVLDAVVLQTE